MNSPSPHLSSGSRPGPLALAALACLSGGAALAQDAGGTRNAAFTPTFSAEESLSDIRYRPGGGNGLDSITRISPGLRYSAHSGGIQGSLDYAANMILRAGHQGDSGHDLQNSLSANFIAEAISNRAFIEARASISQQTISAFGQQSVEGDLQQNSNRTEVVTASLAPSLRGSLNGLAQYELRAEAAGTLAKDSPADSLTTSTSAALNSPSSSTLIGWSLSGTEQRTHYRGGQRSQDDRLTGTVLVRPRPDLTLSLDGGREIDDDGIDPRQAVFTYGAGLKWAPSQRTRFDLGADKRFFGHSSHLLFEHRMARSAWTYSYTKDITSSSSANGVGQPLTRFDLQYALEASSQPDPDLRRTQVLNELQAAGLNPYEIVAGGFLTSARSLQQRQDLSWTLQGQRGTVALQAFSSSLRTLSGSAGLDPLGGEAVRQFGYTGTFTYRLTPQSTLSLLGSQLRTLATTLQPGSDLKSASLSLSSQISPRATTQLSARYTVFNSSADPYKEASLAGSISLRF